MNNLKIGVIVESFRQGLEGGIRKAAQVGAQGIQIYASQGELAPEDLTVARQKEIIDIIRSEGLVVSALCSEMGGFTTNLDDNRIKIDRTKKIMDLALEMGTNVVTAHIGVVPRDNTLDAYKAIKAACQELAEHGENIGATFAIETGPETADVLKGFIDDIDSRGLGVNFDPANLVMVVGDDPVKGVYTLKDHIVHTHAKDGIQFRKSYPEHVYGTVPEHYVADDGKPNYMETPLGEGKVDFDGWIRALVDTGFKGFLTIEREVGDSPEKDIKLAVDF
ncbi:MAG: sugar phosphate isomerase/epimerase, partial [Clostridiales bacterium]|nr:sugar phosphate isomerase/epimerase [Clostridiales bacterium]